MISKIHSSSHAFEISTSAIIQKGEGLSLRSTITSQNASFKSSSISMKGLLRIVFFPLLWPMRQLYVKMAPTMDELERFEDLVSMAARATQVYIDDRSKGKEELKKAIAFSNTLYDLFTGKWLSWTEGIVFMRAHLIQINMHLNTLIGDEDAVGASAGRLKKLGYIPRGDIELQRSYTKMLRQARYRPFLKMGSFLMKLLKLFF